MDGLFSVRSVAGLMWTPYNWPISNGSKTIEYLVYKAHLMKEKLSDFFITLLYFIHFNSALSQPIVDETPVVTFEENNFQSTIPYQRWFYIRGSRNAIYKSVRLTLLNYFYN